MASNCYNTFTFFGNQEVLSKVVEWKSALQSVVPTDTDPKSGRAIKEIFFPSLSQEKANIFSGAKWAYPDFGDEIDLTEHQLGFVSASNEINGLQNRLLLLLADLDKNVVVELSYYTQTYEEGVRITAIGSDGEIKSEISELHYDDEESKLNPDYSWFYEHQVDGCNDLINAVPGIKENIKKHRTYLKRMHNKLFKAKSKGV